MCALSCEWLVDCRYAHWLVNFLYMGGTPLCLHSIHISTLLSQKKIMWMTDTTHCMSWIIHKFLPKENSFKLHLYYTQLLQTPQCPNIHLKTFYAIIIQKKKKKPFTKALDKNMQPCNLLTVKLLFRPIKLLKTASFSHFTRVKLTLENVSCLQKVW